MTIFSGFADAPDQIKKEGEEITLKFHRNNDGTGVISWNIPISTTAGCAPDASHAYDGIVITVDSKPANYIGTSPKDGTFYQGDPTVDADLHAGDKIETALVISAFYNDRTTKSVNVDGLLPRTAYYVSGYAVDNVGRYHREGVHAYSLPTNQYELDKSTPDKAAYHDVYIDVLGGISQTRSTGLVSTTTYDFTLMVNGKEYTIYVDGVDALTYSTLVTILNEKFSTLENPIVSPDAPSLNGYYVDILNKTVYKWDGSTHIKQDAVVSDLEPGVPIDDTYWYNPTTKVLSRWEDDEWVVINLLNLSYDPVTMKCGQLWFDGTNVWEWDGNHWCKLNLFIQTRNPLLPALFGCNAYWFDQTNKQLFKYNDQIRMWDEVLAILSPNDPNTLNTGNFWFNETDELIYQFTGGTWNELADIRYEERGTDGDIAFPVAGHYWFIPSEAKLYKRNLGNSVWILQEIASYPTDPRVRLSCDLWWEDDGSTSALHAWDLLNETWVTVGTFISSLIDPVTPPNVPSNSIWLNPETGVMTLLDSVTCETLEYISLPTNPLDSTYAWYDTKNKVWWIMGDDGWEEIDVVVSESDPFIVNIADLWFDLDNELLKYWSGSEWLLIPYSSVPLSPELDSQWLNSLTNLLYSWNGTAWVRYNPLVHVELLKDDPVGPYSRDRLSFATRKIGCTSSISIKMESENLLGSLSDNIIYLDPVEGDSGLVAGAMQRQLGVGDDGSPDERRALHVQIRDTIGGITTVELKKAQIDQCINNALSALRKYSNIPYTRTMFFLDVKRNQQTYQLTNKCVGFNKIHNISAIYRMGGAFFSGAYAGNDIFGVSTLQNMYRNGSFDMLSFHLVSSFVEELETLFARRIMYQWIERSRELKIYQNFNRAERVLLDATIERPEQELFTDRDCELWIKEYAIAEAKLMLSQVRGKFQQLPGPNGSTALNTSDLIQQANAEKEKLMEQIYDQSMQNLQDVGMKAHFIMG